MPYPRSHARLSPAEDLALRARPAVWSLRACLGLNALLLLAGILLAVMLPRADAASPAVDRMMNLTASVIVLSMLAMVPTAVFFLRWLYLARTNLDLVATHRLRNSPGWLMVSWFVPLGNAWFPYEATYEVWRLSGVYAELSPVEAAHGIGWWWVAWLAYWGALTVAQKSGALLSVLLTGVLGAVAAWLAERVVRRMTERQTRMFAHHPPPAPPERRG